MVVLRQTCLLKLTACDAGVAS